MKTIKTLFLSTLLATAFISCGDDDDGIPEQINEEEVITTLIATFTPTTGGDTVTLTSRDLDGDGPDAPTVTVVGNFAADTNYDGAVQFLNETESPVEDITEEVEEENNEHQVFYVIGSGLNLTTTYNDTDADGNPLGLDINASAGAASTGNLTIVLRHEPMKPNDGTLNDAGGETDIIETFSVTIE